MGINSSCFSRPSLIAHDACVHEQDGSCKRKRLQAFFKQRFTNGNTLFHEAARGGELQTLQSLVAQIHESWSQLVESGSLKQLQQDGQLLPSSPTEAVRAAINLRNHRGQTALVMAAQNTQPACCEYLLTQGADRYAMDRCGGRSALHYAVMRHSSGTIHALMDNLPSDDRDRYINIRTSTGLTPLHFAAGLGNVDTLQVLLSYNPDLNCLACFGSLEYFAGIDARSTALHVAACRGDMAVIVELLRYYGQQCASVSNPGLDPRCFKDINHRLPYHVALYYKHAEVATLLHPCTDLVQVFSPEELRPPRGVQKLRILAAAALKAGLLQQLNALQADQPAEPHAGADSSDGKDSVDDENACPICLDEPAVLAVSTCRHAVCQSCAMGLCERMKHDPVACPMCRVPVGEFSSVPSTA